MGIDDDDFLMKYLGLRCEIQFTLSSAGIPVTIRRNDTSHGALGCITVFSELKKSFF